MNPQEPYTFQARVMKLADEYDRLMLDHGDYCRRLGDAADRAARALAVPVEPASRLDGFATSIAIAGRA